MAKKYTYDSVKYYILNNSNCELLSKEYVNNCSMMKFKCECGETFETTFSKFKFRNKRQCNKCGKNITSQKRKFSYEFIKSFVNNLGYELLSETYENNSSNLKLLDKDGYKTYTGYNDLKAGKKGKRFSISNPYTIENISNWLVINNIDFKLLSTTYLGNGTNKENRKACLLKWLCPEGHVFKMVWNDFYAGNRCPICNGKTKRTTDEFVKLVYDLVGDEYEVLSEYINNTTHVLMKHSICGTEWKVTPSNFLGLKTRCPRNECCHKRGKEHYRYNPNLTEKDRKNNASRTSSIEYRNWKVNVFRKYNRKCLICGTPGVKNNELQAHHLYSWDNNPDKRFDVSNGVALCKTHHTEFHNKYVFGNNTKKQFEEYILNFGVSLIP